MLRWNEIGENGAKHIAEALKLMTAVNSVSLDIGYYQKEMKNFE